MTRINFTNNYTNHIRTSAKLTKDKGCEQETNM